MTTLIRRTNSKWPVVTGLLTFLITGSTVALLCFQRLLLFKTNETKECSFAANAAKERVETILANSLSATKTLSFIVTKYNAENDFEEVAKKIIETNQYIDALE
ncbi:MAG: hypothetical protein JSU05_09560, partial [Bacteroidetes bacterium]|nr:hypothetical protein [Bacteroidota bacterium]